MTTEPTHTPGLLEHGADDGWDTARSGRDGVVFRLSYNNPENMTRLIALWNECATIPTADLHKIQTMQDMEEALRKIDKNNNELWKKYIRPGKNRNSGSIEVGNLLVDSKEIAKAALAKAGVE